LPAIVWIYKRYAPRRTGFHGERNVLWSVFLAGLLFGFDQQAAKLVNLAG